MHEITDNIKVQYKLFEGVYLKDLLILGVLTLFLYVFRDIFHPVMQIPIMASGLIMGLYFLSPPKVTPFYSRYSSFYAYIKMTKDPVYYGSRKCDKKLTSNLINLYQISEDGAVQDEKGYFKILEVAPRDLYSLNEENKHTLIGRMANLYRNYSGDLKWLTLRFPSDYSHEKEVLKNVLDKTTHDRARELLYLKVEELNFLEKSNQDLEYFIFVYAEDERLLQKNIFQLRHMLEGELHLSEIQGVKTEQLLSKLMNQNTMI